MLIIILLIFLIYFLIRTGGGNQIKIVHPLYIIKKVKCENTLPAYCKNFTQDAKYMFKYHAGLIHKYNPSKYFVPINNYYGNVYMSIDFLLGHQFIDEIVLIDASLGSLANLLAEIFNVKIHFFSIKTSEKLHKKVIKYNRLPTDKDLRELRGKILICFTMFSTGDIVTPAELHKTREKVIYFNNNLVKIMRPVSHLLLYSCDSYKLIRQIADGEIYNPPFYYPATGSFFIVKSLESPIGTKEFRTVDLHDLNMKCLFFNFCERPQTNYDIKYAKNTLAKLKKSTQIKVLKNAGDLPNSLCDQILLNSVNSKEIVFSERENIQKSIYLELSRNIEINQLIYDYADNTLNIINGYYNFIYEPRIGIIVKVIKLLQKAGNNFVFYNNIEYFRECVMYGQHCYYPNIPSIINKLLQYLPALHVSTCKYEELSVSTEVIVNENFDCFKEAITVFLRPRIKFMKKIKRVFMTSAIHVLINAIHAIHPHLIFYVRGYVDQGIKHIKKYIEPSAGDWIINT